ncbi:protein of unknown function [Amycolatopsis lurida]|uniref:DUF4145 domain-containing protein n=1 Tax=Amycolatopsis lurida NRRL 2430 TaxID=1460371 RepID=A0A2P2FEZ1_AMYLU|nr:DUF4145 domain-containing protein [Amycolatopsis lurida]KFU75302.1 hypothetical protein BB31_42245 [Amycolatopsis lurida NRRL 2430]SEE29450.1 protein of unknown function [Amycolatopsis lurida]
MTSTADTDSDDITVELDDNILDRLAFLICGDDSSRHYRTAKEITRFFNAAGWRRVNGLDGGRYSAVLDTLRGRRRDSDALKAVLLRLADPREYLDDDETRAAVTQELNELLAVEGYQVIYKTGRPALITQTPTMNRPAMQAPVQLTASLADVVSDAAFGEQLKARLDEAHACWKNGAPTAAIIMLGSLLEGVLYDLALSQHRDGRAPNDHLESLINLARSKGWLPQDVVDYAHVLRHHRNLVHPKKQFTLGYSPKDSTVRIAWNVVVATLNDLAAVKNPSPDQSDPATNTQDH